MHNVPKGAESHFRLVIVSSQFGGLSTLKVKIKFESFVTFLTIPTFQRHQLVNTVLKEDYTEVHAMAIEVYSPDQWEQMDGNSDVQSPNCRGGSKL